MAEFRSMAQKTGTAIAAALLALALAAISAQCGKAQEAVGKDDEAFGRLCRCLEGGRDISQEFPELGTPAVIAFLLDAGQKRPDLGSRATAAVRDLLSGVPDALPALVRIASGAEVYSGEAARIVRDIRSAHPSGIGDTIRMLDGPESRYAASALRSLGKHAVPHLCEALRETPGRSSIVVVLGELGPAAGPAIPTLLALLGQKAAESAAIVTALGQIGAEEAVETLAEIAQDRDAELAVRAILALGQLGEKAQGAIPVLVNCLRHPDPTIKDRAGWALSQMGDAVLPAAIFLLTSEDGELQLDACVILGKLGEKARPAGPELLKLLRCKNPRARAGAAWAIGQIGFTAEEAVRALVHALEDEDRYVRDNAVWALAHMPHCEIAITEVADALTCPDPDRRAAAAWILGEMSAEQGQVVQKLSNMLKDPYPPARANAVRSLGKLPATDESIAAMIPLLADPTLEVRDLTVWTIAALGETALPHLATALGGADTELRYGASCALYEMGTRAYEALPHLLHALSDPDVRVRTNAAGALGRLGVLGRPAAPALAQALKDPQPEVRLCAAWAIGRVCAFDRDPGVTALQRARQTESDPQVSRMIEQVLGQLTK